MKNTLDASLVSFTVDFMQKSSIAISLITLSFLFPLIASASTVSGTLQHSPTVSGGVGTAIVAATTQDTPERVIIPSIGLNAPIQDVGINALGQMDVPSASTKNVGWYEGGTVPGNMGSAVLDAHVIAAFANLYKVKVGGHIWIVTTNGTLLDFVVTDSEVNKVSDISPQSVFSENDGRYLNLITCAGKPLKGSSTYDHRLVVYAKLVAVS
jgi:LPXTG-site transpeptidase (sortase) family protein